MDTARQGGTHTPVDLDEPQLYMSGPTALMARAIYESPRLLLEGWHMTAYVHLPAEYQKASRAIVVGMGGSAIVGDLVWDTVRQQESLRTIIVNRDDELPPWVDASTLVILSSHSGNTREVLACVDAAMATGAKVLAVTSGGALGRLAEQRSLPVCPLPTQGPPRTVLPFAIGALFRLLCEVGLVPQWMGEELVSAARRLRGFVAALDPVVPASYNIAKALAADLQDRLPLFYFPAAWPSVGRRWKTQMNENAKSLAIASGLPEDFHNGVVGLEAPGFPRDRIFGVLLESEAAPHRLQRHFDTMEDLLDDLDMPYRRLALPGGMSLEWALHAILLGDYVSLYLALLRGVDPVATRTIDRLKASMRLHR